MSRANEPAYPIAALDEPVGEAGGRMRSLTREKGGLTIRERFAMAALEGIIASGRKSSSVVLDVVAEAREYADAMLDELAREPRK